MEKKQAIILIVLALLLVAAITYIIVDKLQTRQMNQLQNAFASGYQLGLTDVITTMYNQTANCQIATMTVGNETRQVVDISCLQQK